MVKTVKPVLSISQCVGDLTAGERGGVKSPNLMLDNSPLEFLNKKYKNRNLTLTTTNGTECIIAAASGDSEVLIGSMLNLKAIARFSEHYLKNHNKKLSIVIAGRNNTIAEEDLHVASEIAFSIKNSVVKGYIQPLFHEDSLGCFVNSDSGKNLISKGKFSDVEFCAQRDVYDVVPVYSSKTNSISIIDK